MNKKIIRTIFWCVLAVDLSMSAPNFEYTRLENSDELELPGRHTIQRDVSRSSRDNDFYDHDNLLENVDQGALRNEGIEVKPEYDQDGEFTGNYIEQDYDAQLRNDLSSRAKQKIRDWLRKQWLEKAKLRDSNYKNSTSIGDKTIEESNRALQSMYDKVSASAKDLADNRDVRLEVKGLLDQASEVANTIETLIDDPNAKNRWGTRSSENKEQIKFEINKLIELNRQIEMSLIKARATHESEIEEDYKLLRALRPPRTVHKKINNTQSIIVR